jgi:hypothetical protein
MSNVQVKLTDKRNFVIYESGKYIPGTGFGDAVLVGGPQGEKQTAAFVSHNKTQVQAAFFGAVGQIIVEAFFRTANKQPDTGDPAQEFEVTLSVSRVNELVTTPIQGKIAGSANLEPLWVYRGQHTREGLEPAIDGNYTQITALGYGALIRDMLKTACVKALTIPTEQKMFWGERRPRGQEGPALGKRRYSVDTTSPTSPETTTFPMR